MSTSWCVSPHLFWSSVIKQRQCKGEPSLRAQCSVTVWKQATDCKMTTLFCFPGITMIWNWKMPSTQPSWRWRYIVCYKIPENLSWRIRLVSFFCLLYIFSFTLCLSVVGELWGSDDRGEHWSGNLQRGWLQKAHPSGGERLPGSHCVITPFLMTGLSGHISRQRHQHSSQQSHDTV